MFGFLRKSTTKNTTPKAAKDRLSYCERGTATATSPYHVRVIGAEGFKVSGGVPYLTICGSDLGNGWDIYNRYVSVEEILDDAAHERQHPICGACVEVVKSGDYPEQVPNAFTVRMQEYRAAAQEVAV